MKMAADRLWLTFNIDDFDDFDHVKMFALGRPLRCDRAGVWPRSRKYPGVSSVKSIVNGVGYAMHGAMHYSTQ